MGPASVLRHRLRHRFGTPGRAVAAVGTVLGTALIGGVLSGAAPAVAADWVPDYEAPFGCGQRWEAGTRDGHSPSWYSVDFNRDDDYRAPVLMSAAGLVTSVVDTGTTSYGRYVVVDHGRGHTSVYAHLDEQWVVPGQWLDQGTVLGLLGTSGGSTGPHLHFEERLDRVVRWAYLHGAAVEYNSTVTSYNCGDVPVTGDWNGDAGSDVGVYRPRLDGASVFRLRRPSGQLEKVHFGRAIDRPVTGDWNGDGRTDVGVWRQTERTFLLRSPSGATESIRFGGMRDVPLAGDWNGDGTSEVGVYRPGPGIVRLRAADGSVSRFSFAGVSGLPVTGDWDGDSVTDIGFFDVRQATWTLRRTSGQLTQVDFGAIGSLPVTGDWNRDGVDDLGTWRPTAAAFALRRQSSVTQLPFGRPRR